MTLRSVYSMVLALPVLSLLAACAQEVSTSARESEQKRLDAHVSQVYVDTLHQSPLGVYWCTLQKGSGKAVPKEGFVYVHQTEYNMYYDITSSTREQTAKQLGTWSQTTYYTPDLFHTGNASMMVGFEEILTQMRVGEARRLILPSWLSGYTEDASYPANTTTMVYDIEVVDVADNIDDYQIAQLEAFRNRHYPGVDSLRRGFYKVTLQAGGGDTIAIGESASSWYVGKFLDGFCFDTNVADTAKFHFIYNESASASNYQKFSVTLEDPEHLLSSEYLGSADSANQDAITGFHMALRSMHYGETALFFFHSDYGYKAGQQNNSTGAYTIPPYKPLMFWIHLPEV